MFNVRNRAANLKHRGAVFSLAVVMVLLCSFNTAFAAAAITAVPAGNGVYAVVGSGLSGIAGLKVTMTYDPATLGNPRVEKGALLGNAMLVANPNQSGIVTFAIISASGFSGSGSIALVSFDKKSEPGLLTGLTVNEAINVNGAPLAVTTSYSNAPTSDTTVKTETPAAGSSSQTPAVLSGGSQQAPGTSTTTSGGSVYLGTVTMPGDTASGQTEKKAESPKYDQPAVQGQGTTTAGQGDETAKSEPEEKKVPAAKKDVAYPSPVERIKADSGKLTMEKLVAAFDLAKDLPYTQTPRIVLSDGKSSVQFSVRLGEAKESPSFALESAKLLSLKQSENGDWLVEAVPVLNANEASLTVSQGESTMHIPVVVARPLKESDLGNLKPLSEKSFTLFLKERGTREAPRYDLNGDGKRDYLDDYIFAANYLALKGPLPAGDKKPQPAPPKKQ